MELVDYAVFSLFYTNNSREFLHNLYCPSEVFGVLKYLDECGRLKKNVQPRAFP